MFYLVEFLKVLKENVIVAFIFVMSSVAVVSVSHNYKGIEAKLSNVSTKNGQPYFNALVSDGVRVDSVVRRMKSLPGVVGVETVKSLAIKKEVKTLEKIYGTDLLKNLVSSKYKKIKIELKHGLKLKNQTLIKEYLQRLIGKESVTVGNLKTPQKVKLEKGNIIQIITSWGKWYLVSILAGLWLISLALLVKPLKKSSYIMEKFQRSNHNFFKMFGVGLLSIIIPAYIANVAYAPKVDLIPFAAMLTMFGIVLLTSALVKK